MRTSEMSRRPPPSGVTLSPLSDADAWRPVVEAFDNAVAAPSDQTIDAMHAAARVAAAALSRQGFSPERAVVALKRHLSGHGGCCWTPSYDVGPQKAAAAARIYAELFPCFVAAFYADAPTSSRDSVRRFTTSTSDR